MRYVLFYVAAILLAGSGGIFAYYATRYLLLTLIGEMGVHDGSTCEEAVTDSENADAGH